ncbi:MAG: glycosyltransferase [Candidatus Caldatribacteriota bacterium]
MGKQVVIMTTAYLPHPDANGVCASNIANEFLQRGYQVSVLCSRQRSQQKEEYIHGIAVYRVTTPLVEERAAKNAFGSLLLLRINRAFHLPVYPIDSLLFLFRFYRKLRSLVTEKSIDTIIAINNPLEGCLAGYWVKKKRENSKFCIFDVDSFSNKVDGKYIGGKLKFRLHRRWEQLLFPQADAIIAMETHEKHYNTPFYDPFKEKIHFSNFPFLITRNLKAVPSPPSLDQKYSGVYLGTFNTEYRNPKPICEAVTLIDDFYLTFYGRGDALPLIESYARETSGRISYGGFIAYSKGQEALEQAEFLISIGNAKSEMVPSKIFEYIAFGKPIIHFYSFAGDPVLAFLGRFPLALAVDTNQNVEENAGIIKRFIETNMGKRVDHAMIESVFLSNTPKYSVDLIEKSLE